jgi:hypothetical protein
MCLKLRPPCHPFNTAMSTELPYAADAEMSLNYDELEVSKRLLFIVSVIHNSPFAGFTNTVPERACAKSCHYPDQI